MPGAVFLALGVLILLPELLLPPIWTESARYNLVWLPGFTDGMLRGDPYPRWLPATFGGLGSPTFFYYPPLYFEIAGAVRWLVRAVSPMAAGSIASALLFAVSGFAMRAWLRPEAGERRAFWGGVATMLAPYHLNEIYWRGAVAEASIYAVLPLLLIAVDRTAAGRRGGVIAVALAYAALLYGHLPLALLASLTVLPAYIGWRSLRSARPARVIADSMIGMMAGIGLAAPYWWPALALARFNSQAALQGPFLVPAQWFFTHPARWPDPPRMTWVVMLALAALASVADLFARRRRLDAEARFWSVAVIVGVLLMAGVPAAFWSLPFVDRVQFPWRLLVLVEFGTVAAVALAGPDALGPPWRLTVAACLAASVAVAWPQVAPLFVRAAGPRPFPAGYDAARHDDAPEYLPNGRPYVRTAAGYPDPDRVPLPLDRALATAEGARVRVLRADGDGALRLEVQAPRETVVVVRRFWFPNWIARARDGVAVATASSADRLVSWRVPAGRSIWTLARATTPQQRVARLIALASLAMLLVHLAVDCRRGASLPVARAAFTGS